MVVNEELDRIESGFKPSDILAAIYVIGKLRRKLNDDGFPDHPKIVKDLSRLHALSKRLFNRNSREGEEEFFALAVKLSEDVADMIVMFEIVRESLNKSARLNLKDFLLDSPQE